MTLAAALIALMSVAQARPTRACLVAVEESAEARTLALRAALEETAPDMAVTLLMGEGATVERIQGCIDTALRADEAILYLAGPGVRFGRRVYVPGADSLLDSRLPHTSIGLHALGEQLMQQSAHVILLLDLSPRSWTPMGLEVERRLSLPPTLEAPGASLVALGVDGGLAGEVAEALGGAADGDRDRRLTVGELAVWLEDRHRVRGGRGSDRVVVAW